MKKCSFMAILFVFVLFVSCGRSAQNYFYVPIVVDSNGKHTRGLSENFQAYTDSQAVILAYEKFCIDKKMFYKLGKELEDTTKVPNPAIDFFLSTSLDGNDISKINFVNREVVFDSLYKEIVEPEKDAFIKYMVKKEENSRMYREMVKNSVRITSYYLKSPNSAAGVDAVFYYKNLSKKDIKYFYWEGYPINAVGDAVTCDIRDYSNFRGKDTGPIKPGRTGGGVWECAWYNWTAKKLVLTAVEIEYMDGSNLRIEGDDLYLIGKKKN